jgi:energy-converting hydrogenase Eha subunit B
MNSVGEEILVELKRNRELLDIYKELPDNAGFFGAAMIKQDIEEAERALAEGDVVKILQAYQKLKGNE